jgi:uncharacterized protein YfdQ (DUF2303 family)
MNELNIDVVNRLIQLGGQVAESRTGPNGETMFPVSAPGGGLAYTTLKSDTPKQIEESPVFEHADSFVDYVKEYRDQGGAKTRIFASPQDARFIAALDYHADATTPRRRTHNAIYSPVKSEAWKAWEGIDKKPLDQSLFASFIEQHAGEIIKPEGSQWPDAATLLEVASDLNIHVSVKLKSRKNLTNGLVQLEYVEESDGGKTSNGSIVFPKMILLRMPVFFGEEPHEIMAHLRYNGRPGEPLTFKIEIDNKEALYEKAFLALCGRIGQSSGIVPLLGKPGSASR